MIERCTGQFSNREICHSFVLDQGSHMSYKNYKKKPGARNLCISAIAEVLPLKKHNSCFCCISDLIKNVAVDEMLRSTSESLMNGIP